MTQRKKPAAKPPAKTSIRNPILPPGKDRMRHFAQDHWAVKLVALTIDTVPMTAAAAVGAALLMWRLWP